MATILNFSKNKQCYLLENHYFVYALGPLGRNDYLFKVSKDFCIFQILVTILNYGGNQNAIYLNKVLEIELFFKQIRTPLLIRTSNIMSLKKN